MGAWLLEISRPVSNGLVPGRVERVGPGRSGTGQGLLVRGLLRFGIASMTQLIWTSPMKIYDILRKQTAARSPDSGGDGHVVTGRPAGLVRERAAGVVGRVRAADGRQRWISAARLGLLTVAACGVHSIHTNRTSVLTRALASGSSQSFVDPLPRLLDRVADSNGSTRQFFVVITAVIAGEVSRYL
jgi:hypothetical protein